MARLALNKSSLTRQNQLLKGYREFLPALDMKRRQLLAEQARARAELAQ
ncbi:ATP synthase subunit D, partial [Candidatus Endoriftia persephone str. Guaymas]|nr:ATP synthase subunit D [Candidatus Endoriftia persephone str. Guaymas]